MELSKEYSTNPLLEYIKSALNLSFKNGVYLDGILLNENIKVNDLKLNDNNHILFKITSKKHNDSFGGFNIFGKNYGDYPQDILMTISYEK